MEELILTEPANIKVAHMVSNFYIFGNAVQ